MSLRCKDKIKCPNGNCIGCVNGKLLCSDVNCYPSCTGCAGYHPLVGSRINGDGDIQPTTQPFEQTTKTTTANDVTFAGENMVFTIFIIVITFVIIGFVFYFFYGILEKKSIEKYK